MKTYQKSILGQGFLVVSNVLLHGYKSLKPQDKWCYLLLMQTAELSWKNEYKDKDGVPYIWIGQTYLQKELRIGETTLRESLKRLEEVKLIKMQRRGLTLTNLTYIYTINLNDEDYLRWKKEKSKGLETGKARIRKLEKQGQVINKSSKDLSKDITSLDKSKDNEKKISEEAKKIPIEKESFSESVLDVISETGSPAPAGEFMTHRFPTIWPRFVKKKDTPDSWNSNDLVLLFCYLYYQKYTKKFGKEIVYAVPGQKTIGGGDSGKMKVLKDNYGSLNTAKVVKGFIEKYEILPCKPKDSIMPSIPILYGWKNDIFPFILNGKMKEAEAEDVARRGIRGEITDKEWKEVKTNSIL